MKPFVFRGRGGGGGVFFRIRRGNNQMMVVIDVVDFIFVCECEMYCGGGGVRGVRGGGVRGGGVRVGVGVGVGVKYHDIVHIKTSNTHIHAF